MKNAKLERKIAELRAGDQRAFDYIYEQTNRSVYFAILYIVRDKMYAEDLLQETFVKAVRSLDSYTPDTNFPAWLMRIGKNLALNHIKRASREICTDFDTESYRYGSKEMEIPFVFEAAAKILAEDEYQIPLHTAPRLFEGHRDARGRREIQSDRNDGRFLRLRRSVRRLAAFGVVGNADAALLQTER